MDLRTFIRWTIVAINRRGVVVVDLCGAFENQFAVFNTRASAATAVETAKRRAPARESSLARIEQRVFDSGMILVSLL